MPSSNVRSAVGLGAVTTALVESLNALVAPAATWTLNLLATGLALETWVADTPDDPTVLRRLGLLSN